VPRGGKRGPTWSRTLLDRAQSSSQQVTEVASIVKQQTLHNNRHNLTPDVHHHISSRSHFRGKRKIDTAPPSTSRHRQFSAIYQPAVTSPPSNKLWADMERIPTTSFSFAVGRCGSSSAPSNSVSLGAQRSVTLKTRLSLIVSRSGRGLLCATFHFLVNGIYLCPLCAHFRITSLP
jgi:hypothetical protein